jgi:hypothetical protein
MTNYKTALEIIIDSITDPEWEQLQMRADSKRAFHKSKIFGAKRSSAIEFADWILKHNLVNGYDNDGYACWVLADGSGTTYNSLELYNAYMNGDFEPDDEDDLSDWDNTLMDGLEEEEGF